MAADTVARGRGRGCILFDLSAVVVGVAGKVGRVAGSAGAAIAGVHSGIAVAVGSSNPRPVFGGMAVCAGIFVHRTDDISGMAVDAERRVGHRGGMVVGVVAKISSVAASAGTPCDGGDVIFVYRIRQRRGCCVAVSTGVFMHSHRIVSRMAGRDAGWGVGDMAQAASGVIHQAMLSRVVRMTDQAAGRIEAGADDVLNRRAGTGRCLAGGVMAGVA